MEYKYPFPLHLYSAEELRNIVSEYYKIDGYEHMNKSDLIKHINTSQKTQQYDLVEDNIHALSRLNKKQLHEVIRNFNLHHHPKIKGYSKLNRLDLIGVIIETKKQNDEDKLFE